MEPNVVQDLSVPAQLGCGVGSAPLTPSLEAFPSTTLLLLHLHLLLWGDMCFPPIK